MQYQFQLICYFIQQLSITNQYCHPRAMWSSSIIIPKWILLIIALLSSSPSTAFQISTLKQSTPSKITPTSLHSSRYEDLYSAVHRKEFEMKNLNKEHQTSTSPLKIAMSYVQNNIPKLRLARALRRVYEDPENAANPNRRELTEDEQSAESKYGQGYQNSLSMRKGCFVADIKRKSLSRPGEVFCRFDDAAGVATAMVDMGADCVFVNIDYMSYGGDVSELKSTVRAVRKCSDTAAVVMKDIIVDEIQLGLAKEAECDGVVLIASVLGPALETFLNLCSVIGLEAIVECHTKNEVDYALDCLAQNILVSNYDRVRGEYFPDQAKALAGLFPGSGGPIIALAGGGIESADQVKEHLAAGYDGVVVGRAIMGNTRAPEFIKVIKDKVMLPAEFSGWDLEDDVDFDLEGNAIYPEGPISAEDTPYS